MMRVPLCILPAWYRPRNLVSLSILEHVVPSEGVEQALLDLELGGTCEAAVYRRDSAFTPERGGNGR